MSEDGFDELQAICANINSALAGKGIINLPVISDNQDIHSQEVQERYSRGYQAWLESNYSAAMADFSWLTLHCPLEPHFHLALAGALQMQQEFTLALSAYACGLLLEAKDPQPVYQMAVCLHALGKGADAREALQTVIEMSDMCPEYAPVVAKANLLLGKV
ncbi:tetratricopeptide repeat protein [Yersinia hibernica]|uniref:CesD/SycD/LcrH family type III secretion system chaperone n=1 Tax=Yersinia enterocolitica LC20 TaxID=1443113 RepID=A0A7U4GIJ9_YEREN|nr:tetratricopeptide repeat protein [Yersinia hibernica]AHM76158.1 CesD/SycD/LcrH family type III secretion system chaperone [Yersinia hibernica]OVZ84790.1 CesD/SycD/LcrH family type III secretion system chaperone [Yersinia kristensenii]